MSRRPSRTHAEGAWPEDNPGARRGEQGLTGSAVRTLGGLAWLAEARTTRRAARTRTHAQHGLPGSPLADVTGAGGAGRPPAGHSDRSTGAGAPRHTHGPERQTTVARRALRGRLQARATEWATPHHTPHLPRCALPWGAGVQPGWLPRWGPGRLPSTGRQGSSAARAGLSERKKERKKERKIYQSVNEDHRAGLSASAV
jgi:hypothetical protein